MAENGTLITNKRGPYKKLERLHLSHEIERLLLDGYSSAYIQQKLGLSERTYNRHRRESFLEQKESLLGLNTDFAMEQLVECDAKFRMLEEAAIKLAQDPSVDGNTRVTALGTAGEFVKQRIILLNQGPELIMHLKGYPKSIERYTEILARKNGLLLPQQHPQRPHLEQQREEEKNLVEQ